MDKLKIIPEKLSLISFYSTGTDSYVLDDFLRRRSFYLNKTAYSICSKIDGNNTLEEIGRQIAEENGISPKEGIRDVIDFYKFLKKEGLVLVKNSFQYKYIRFYYSLLRISEGGDKRCT